MAVLGARVPRAGRSFASDGLAGQPSTLDRLHGGSGLPSIQLKRSQGATVARTLVDYEKLKAIANAELAKIAECAGFAVGIVAHLPDDTGCNWDIKVTRKGLNRAGAPMLREAMLLLRGRYNLRATRV
jgi:hypothetical protein